MRSQRVGHDWETSLTWGHHGEELTTAPSLGAHHSHRCWDLSGSFQLIFLLPPYICIIYSLLSHQSDSLKRKWNHFPTSKCSHHLHCYQPHSEPPPSGPDDGDSSLSGLPSPIFLPLKATVKVFLFQIVNRIMSLLCAEPSSGFPSDSEHAHMTQSKVKVNFYSGTQGPYPLPVTLDPLHWLFPLLIVFFFHMSTWLIPSIPWSSNSNLRFSIRSSLTSRFKILLLQTPSSYCPVLHFL